MGLRFFKRLKLLPGVHLNLTKRGASVSVGPRGAKLTLGTSGVRGTVGLPGTGLYYTTKLNKKAKRGATGAARDPGVQVAARDRLSMGFFRRLITPKNEEHLVDGCRELLGGDHAAALRFFRQCADIPDGAFLAGYLALDAGAWEDARGYLGTALQQSARLGARLAAWGVDLTVSLPVTPEVTVHVAPGKPAALLGLVEASQALGDVDIAAGHAEALVRVAPDDVLARLSLAELRWARADDAQVGTREAKAILKLAEDFENRSAVHGALLLYRARALRTLGMHEAARDTCTALLRRTKDRPPDLLQTVRYERARCYEALGEARRARTDLERVYGQDPDFADVADRLAADPPS